MSGPAVSGGDGPEAWGAAPPPAVDMVSLGMFIIDDIEYLPPRPPVRNIIGGAGAYAALGARLFSPPPELSRTVGWIVDQGSDFPPSMAALIASWQTAAVLRHDPTRLTTRGWNGYDKGEHRAFRYTTPKRRLTAADLPPHLLMARAFHIVSSAARCRELVGDLTARRRALLDTRHARTDVHPAAWDQPARPLVVWEPVPDLCSPDSLLDCTNTLPFVDVCSPNHAELAAYMGDPDGGFDAATGALSTAAVERACEQLLASMPLQSYAVVVRAAEHGCYLAKNGGRRSGGRAGPGTARAPPSCSSHRTTITAAVTPRPKQNLHGGLRPDIDMEALFAGLVQDEEGAIVREDIEIDPGLEAWVPAVWAKADDAAASASSDTANSRVVDPTGGGNAFLGGLAVALARGQSLEEAAVWGNLAASFAIEQVGVPVLGQESAGSGQDRKTAETWNGERVEDRLAAYRARLQARKGEGNGQ